MGPTIAQLTRFSQYFRRFYARQFTPLMERTGLTIRDIMVLLFLANHPEQDTARDVVEYRGLSKSQVSQAVEVLTGRGVLERSPDREDRRVVHLRITEAGEPLAREAQELQAACGARLLETLPEGERVLFLELLTKVLEQAERL
ncbi:MAG: winged helix-turn-helix transcriptional regulator [Oscillibacter sp.]|nr:winged helix-turn-helix transcriptional regulator [Oscillibacter sp.]